jgi:CBS domain containing-hemolysin-like protein
MVSMSTGNLKGMVTLHDLTEAIVGDLPDEDEDSAPEIVKRADGLARRRPGVDR